MKRIILFSIAIIHSLQMVNGQVTNEHLNAYLWEYPLQQNLDPDLYMMQELVVEIQRIIDSGDLFFRPLPNDFGDQLTDAYFLYREPGRILQTISLAYPYLDPEVQTTLQNMVQQLFASTVHQPWAGVPGQPWVHYQLAVDAGKQRKPFTPSNIWGNTGFGPYRPTIQNIYNVWLYAYRTGDLASVAPYYNSIWNFYLSKVGNNHDQGRLYGTMNAHIGMARLAYLFGEEAHINQARTNLENALNFGLDMDQVDDLASFGTQGWNGAYAFAYEERAFAWVNRNYIMHNISAEIGRYLQDYLPADTEARHNYMLNRFPFWWLREAPYFNRWTGDEAIGVPSNAFGTNVPLERWFRNVDAETMASYMISSSVGVADSYWIEALVYAIEANADDVWVDVRQTPFTINYATYQLQLAVLLEGAFNDGDMSTQLNTEGLIPLQQPYNTPPWNYTGTEEAAAIPADVVDWVLVELRDADSPGNATPATIVTGWPKAFFLKNDGSLVGPDGNPPNIGSPTINDNLYIVVRHRNHLDVMSSVPLALTGNTYTYDFTDALAKAHGGAAGYKEIGTGVFGMVAGDIDADGAVFASDFNLWAINFGLITVYLAADVDMDGQVFASDFNKWAVNFGTQSGRGQAYRSQVPD